MGKKKQSKKSAEEVVVAPKAKNPSKDQSGEERSVPRDSMEIPSIPVLSKLDKDKLATEDRAMFVALPKELQSSRPVIAKMKAFISTLVTPEQLRYKILTADPFEVLVFDTTAHRDKAVSKVKRKDFILDGEKVLLKCEPFKFTTRDRETAWIINSGATDALGDIALALREQFAALETEELYKSGVIVHEVLVDGHSNGIFAVQFEHHPPWKEEQLKVKQEARKITVQDPNPCFFCEKDGHGIFECGARGKFSLKPRIGFYCLLETSRPRPPKLNKSDKSDKSGKSDKPGKSNKHHRSSSNPQPKSNVKRRKV